MTDLPVKMSEASEIASDKESLLKLSLKIRKGHRIRGMWRRNILGVGLRVGLPGKGIKGETQQSFSLLFFPKDSIQGQINEFILLEHTLFPGHLS